MEFLTQIINTMKSKWTLFKTIFALAFLASMSFSCANAETEETETTEEMATEPMTMEEADEELPPLDSTASTRPEPRN
ncbi:MAG: hypothetical protein ACI9IP_001567 [Arcticibacterium sp.]|jgi:hypothetical protein